MNTEISPARILAKALCLFVMINIVYALLDLQAAEASGYNLVFPGRTRLPFGISGDPYTVTVDYVDAMFASHLIAAPKQPGEFRVVLIGDSSIWGENLGAYEVISEQWNRLNVPCGEERVRAYNLGYPHPSIVKDLVILDEALEYQPDLVIWFVTLNTLFSQRLNPFLVANRDRAAAVVEEYGISFKQSGRLMQGSPSFYERTLIGRRSSLARRIKLEALGMIWTATGSDTNALAPEETPDFTVDESPRYRGLEPPAEIKPLLLFSALSAGYNLAGSVPLLIVNEPVYIAPEAGARVRYNLVYPRWAYDQYREEMTLQAQSAGWQYLDLWNAVPREYFSDAGLHLSSEGELLLVQEITPVLQSIACAPTP